jgi:hypothetical protein
VNSHPATQPAGNDRVRHYLRGELLGREPLPGLFVFGFQSTGLHTVVFDSVVNHRRTITQIDTKVVACHDAPFGRLHPPVLAHYELLAF